MTEAKYLLLDYKVKKITNYLLPFLGKKDKFYKNVINYDDLKIINLQERLSLKHSEKDNCLIDFFADHYNLYIVIDKYVYDLSNLPRFQDLIKVGNIYIYKYDFLHKKDTVDKVFAGKYSLINEEDKKIILDSKNKYWGDELNPHHGVLYKDKNFKKKLENYLNVNIDYRAELRSAPGDNEFIQNSGLNIDKNGKRRKKKIAKEFE